VSTLLKKKTITYIYGMFLPGFISLFNEEPDILISVVTLEKHSINQFEEHYLLVDGKGKSCLF
jgi:hypothetical protein